MNTIRFLCTFPRKYFSFRVPICTCLKVLWVTKSNHSVRNLHLPLWGSFNVLSDWLFDLLISPDAFSCLSLRVRLSRLVLGCRRLLAALSTPPWADAGQSPPAAAQPAVRPSLGRLGTLPGLPYSEGFCGELDACTVCWEC